MIDPVIRVRDGQFGYRNRVAAQADLAVGPGEIIALLGPNGSGKSTLMKGMLGLVDRMSGQVELFGRPLDELADRSLIGYVPQRQGAAGPIPVTVRELVRSGRLARKGLIRPRRPEDNDAVAAAIEAVGLTGKATAAVSTLSGGQQRRALVARALAGGAEVLLMDEPLAGVDQANQAALAAAMTALVPQGVTIIVVLHELGPLEPLVTRAVCMDGGRVQFDGPIADAPPELLHLGHDHDPHGGPAHGYPDGATNDLRSGMGLFRR